MKIEITTQRLNALNWRTTIKCGYAIDWIYSWTPWRGMKKAMKSYGVLNCEVTTK